MSENRQEISFLLEEWSSGNQSALDQLMPIIYDELRRLAHAYMKRERAGHTLQTTALVNEAYLKLVNQERAQWHNRKHFFAVSAQLMRRILVDRARTKNYQKRGGGEQTLSLDEALTISADNQAAEIIALDEALKELSAFDERKSQVVELRYFGGLSVEETADVLKISPVTVRRDWTTAKAWLYSRIKDEGF
jgi:RNA polymerase sigma-70 factor (ECF subfamily)